MQKLRARNMLDWDEDKVWALDPSSKFELEFDDGLVVGAVGAAIHFSWYFWQLHHHYRELPLNKELFLYDENFTDGLARRLMNKAIWMSRDYPSIDKEDVWKIMYAEVYNKLYVAMATRLLPYISSTDAPDLLELLDDPEISEANSKVTTDFETVDNAYDTIQRVIRGGKYPTNPVVRAINWNNLNMKQMLPSLGPRGLTTDIDSVIYRIPIKRGFAMGFTSIADFAKESRSAAKALLFNKDPVAKAEYFNRKLQFVAAYIRHLEEGDCGTDEAHHFYVPKSLGDDTFSDELLASLVGMTEVLPDGTQRPFRSDRMNYIGKTIMVRSSLTCRWLPSQKVCTKCYGEMSYSLAHGDNPGHVSCTSINEKITQLIISTKHLDFIIHKLRVWVTEKEEEWLASSETVHDKIYLAKKHSGANMVIRFLHTDAPNLIRVNYVSSPSILAENMISSFENIEFQFVNEYGSYTGGSDVIHIARRSNKASFTHEFLEYVKTRGWDTDGTKVSINLDKWDVSKPLFVYPHRHENMSEYGWRVERFIRSSKTAGEGNSQKAAGFVKMLKDYNRKTVDDSLTDAFALISDKISGVHMGHIATILAATRTQDPLNGDYSMPSSMHHGMYSTHDDVIKGRSLGPAFLFQRQHDYFADVDSFIQHIRPSHGLDDLIHVPVGKYKD